MSSPTSTVEPLNAVEDRYGGVRVDLVEEHMDCDVYVPRLKASISQWRQQGVKGVWMKLPIRHAHLVEPTVKEGFRYHHAESDYLMLVYWIPETPDTLPANASHTVGIGAFVMNNNREVLVVQEKSGAFGAKGVWKFPTGVANQGEDIWTAAIREVEEETGIDTEFVEILAFSGCRLRSIWPNLTYKDMSRSKMLLKYAQVSQRVAAADFARCLHCQPRAKSPTRTSTNFRFRTRRTS
ncbi:nudix hydrolase 7 isoform X3 [Populus alba]|uniref:nudix hydrolase 7 isoform X3 n=1 Tax=Populus alba TaxID=43335 RepID=UPI00158A0A05|nr:nudix hydrolase 7-like isoform X2 [Populus alba]